MYLKQGNTFITSDMNDLPFEQFKIGTYIIHVESDDEVDMSTSLTVCYKVGDYFFGMDGLEITCQSWSDDKTDEDEENYNQTKIYTDSQLDENKQDRAYLLLPDRIYHLGNKSKYDNSLYSMENIKEHQDYIDSLTLDEIQNSDSSVEYVIYNYLFGEKDFHEGYPNRFMNKEKFYSSFSLKLDEDNCLVFVVTHDLRDMPNTWHTDKTAHLFNRDGQIVHIHNFNKLYDTVKKVDRYKYCSFKEFDKSLFAHEYNMNKYLNENKSKESIDNINHELLLHFPKFNFDIADFFKPVYEDSEFDVQVYVSDIKAYHKRADVRINGKPYYFAEESFRKAQVEKCNIIFEYLVKHSESGLNPLDGKIYDRGKPANTANYFHNEHGVIWTPSNTSKEKYFLKKDGIYKEVQLDDGEELNELRVQREIHKFNSSNKSGINPYDGYHYANGIRSEIPISSFYCDIEGSMIKYGSNWVYYIKIKDMYVESLALRKEYDLINELKDRKETVRILTKDMV